MSGNADFVPVDGLLAVSWEASRGQQANDSFDRAVETICRLRRLRVSGGYQSRSLRLAAFSKDHDLDAPSKDLKHTRAIAAGWVFPRGDGSRHGSSWIELFEQKGPAAFEDLDGQFCAIVADREVIYASGDCGGLYPWYSHQSNGTAWVSSSAMALASSLGLALDYSSVKSLLLGSPVRSPASLFQHVRRMPFGERAKLADGRLTTDTYWSPFQGITKYKNLRTAAEAGLPLVTQACRQVLRQFDSPVCDLTSGLDTRLLVGGMSMNDTTFATTVTGAADHIDVCGAQEIADKLGWSLVRLQPPTDWGVRRFEFFCEAVRSMEGEIPAHLCDMPQWCKHELAKDFGASATGGGGELFREFPWEHLVLTAGMTSRVNEDLYISLRLRTPNISHPELFGRDWAIEHHNEKRARIREIISQSPESLNTQKLDAVYLWRSSGHFGRYSGGLSTVIPSPVPLMGRDVLEFCLSVPAKFRRGASLIREMINQANPRLANIWTCWGGTAKPMGIRHPLRSLPYWSATFRRWSRKISQRSIGWSIFSDPFDTSSPSSWDDQFVSRLRDRELLSPDNWISAGLYRFEALRAFLTSVARSDFRSHSNLYAMLTIELACRDCDIEPRDAI